MSHKMPVEIDFLRIAQFLISSLAFIKSGKIVEAESYINKAIDEMDEANLNKQRQQIMKGHGEGI